MQKKHFPIVLMTLNFLSALAAFFAISRAIKVADASTWVVPMIWVSLFIISLCLVGVFAKNRLAAEIVVAASLLLSLFFAFNLIHFAVTVLAIFLVLGGLYSIQKDLDLNVKISLWKSLYMGKFKIIMGLALLISSQYFSTIKAMEGPVNVPRIDLSEVAGPLLSPILGIVNPEFAQASRENITIDEFIIKTQQDSEDDAQDQLDNMELIEANMPAGISEKQKELLRQQALAQMSGARSKMLEQNRQLILLEGRRQFSKITGKKINGDEKVSSVFIGMINDKINNYFQPGVGGEEKSNFFPLVLTLILFLTIWPVGSLLSNIWFITVILIFKVFVRFGLVEIKRVSVEREMIS